VLGWCRADALNFCRMGYAIVKPLKKPEACLPNPCHRTFHPCQQTAPFCSAMRAGGTSRYRNLKMGESVHKLSKRPLQTALLYGSFHCVPALCNVTLLAACCNTALR